MNKSFGFKLIKKCEVHSQPTARDYTDIVETFSIYQELSTDALFIEHKGSLCQMLDSETGLPLTYKVWQEKSQDNK